MTTYDLVFAIIYSILIYGFTILIYVGLYFEWKNSHYVVFRKLVFSPIWLVVYLVVAGLSIALGAIKITIMPAFSIEIFIISFFILFFIGSKFAIYNSLDKKRFLEQDFLSIDFNQILKNKQIEIKQSEMVKILVERNEKNNASLTEVYHQIVNEINYYSVDKYVFVLGNICAFNSAFIKQFDFKYNQTLYKLCVFLFAELRSRHLNLTDKVKRSLDVAEQSN